MAFNYDLFRNRAKQAQRSSTAVNAANVESAVQVKAITEQVVQDKLQVQPEIPKVVVTEQKTEVLAQKLTAEYNSLKESYVALEQEVNFYRPYKELIRLFSEIISAKADEKVQDIKLGYATGLEKVKVLLGNIDTVL